MKLVLLIIMLLISSAIRCQETLATEEQVEQLAEEDEAETGEDWIESMEHLLRHPVAVNTASEEDLLQLRILNPLQITHLLQYRRLLGPLLHVYELQAVPGWDPETVRKLIPYVTVATPAAVPLKKILTEGEHRLATTWATQLQTATGFDRSQREHFAGGKARLLLRYRFTSGAHLRWGYTGEKDAGEPFSKTVFDFHSFHFFWKRPGWLRTIVVGDYSINMGQGLIHWQSLAFKKSSEVLAVRRQAAVILPYQSSGEFYFNRGMAVGAGSKRCALHLFFSQRALDGNTETDSTLETSFSSFDVSGWHRTKNEQAGRGSVHQRSYGGTLHYQGAGYRVGINGVRHQFSLPMQKADALYRQFSISGNNWMNASIDYQATFHNLHFFGELAADRSGAPAALNGFLLSLDKAVDLSVLHRCISKKYHSLYGNAFTEQRLPSNENGVYTGLRLWFRTWRLDAYYDMFRFPWLRFRADAPGTGNEYLLQLSYQPNRQTEIILRYRREGKPLNDTNEDAVIHTVSRKERSALRLHASFQLNRLFSFRARMETTRHLANGSLPEHGFLFYAEGNLQTTLRAAVQARFLVFETEGFNSRIYAYESDVYGFSIPALYDKGFRFYVNLRYNLARNFSCWLRYAATIYGNRNESGSGLNLVKGNTVSDVKIQASYRF